MNDTVSAPATAQTDAAPATGNSGDAGNVLYTPGSDGKGDASLAQSPDPGTTAPPEETKPVDYKLELPKENGFFGDKDVERIVTFAKEQGLSNEAAQKLLDGEVGKLNAHQENLAEGREKQAEDWAKQLEDDTEYGGEKFTENVETARRVINKFASDDMKNALKNSGFANFPPLVKMLTSIGKSMRDDTLIRSSDSQGGKATKSMEETFYGKTS